MVARVENSRQTIEQNTVSKLSTARDELIAQSRGAFEYARARMQQASNSLDTTLKSCDDEVLELTRRDGTTLTTTLGQRIMTYRKLVSREDEHLKDLFRQRSKVSQQITQLSAELLGPMRDEHTSKSSESEAPGSFAAEKRALMMAMEAEKERVRLAAEKLSREAIQATKASEKDLKTKHQQAMLEICNSLFHEDDDGDGDDDGEQAVK
ncbi:MAG: hypothetical protein Q9222_000371 [Ikaeria aurantiellina]